MAGSGVSFNNPEMDGRFAESVIRDAIEVELRNRGWTRGSQGGSDVMVGYVAALVDELSDADLIRRFGSINHAFGYSRGAGRGAASFGIDSARPGYRRPAW